MKAKILFLGLLISFLISPTVAQAQADPEALKAFEAGFDKAEDFDTLFEFVLPSKDEIKWREVKWLPSLWDGIQLATEKQKPLFIWAMNGDPLGCV